MTKRKLKEAAQAKETEDGGYAVQARGKVRQQGIFVPIGNDRSCLRDAMRAAMLATKPSLALKEDAWCATEHWCCTEH